MVAKCAGWILEPWVRFDRRTNEPTNHNEKKQHTIRVFLICSRQICPGQVCPQFRKKKTHFREICPDRGQIRTNRGQTCPKNQEHTIPHF